MRFDRLPLLAAALMAASFAGTALAAEPALTLRRVMLSTGGVGYFEYEAKVADNAELRLSVRSDRIDDVMKSIVVYDDKGGIGTIGLQGREPLREQFRDLPFGPEALTSPETLLSALRGQEVRISGPREIVGRLLAVTGEDIKLPGDGGTLGRHRLTLLTAEGLRQAILEDIDALRLSDKTLQSKLDTALATMAGQGDRDHHSLTLYTTGQGERTVRVGYVVEAPLWKAAYRLTLDGDSGQGGLQGWAVLENLSGENWDGIDLTVISGNPVTFRQALYNAYFVNRPEVPVEVLGRILPRVDQGGVAAVPDAIQKSFERVEAQPRAFAAPAPAAAPPPPPGRFAGVAAAASGEATTQVTFHHPGPVSVVNGNSLMVPIVSRTVPAKRLALYQPATDARHPLAAVRLANDGASGLPPGILTLYERTPDGVVSHVGDARMSALPVGQARLLSFATDQQVTIDRADGESQAITNARIADGLLQTVTADRLTATYTIAGAAQEPRLVVIEHPRRAGWELVLGAADASGIETTADAYRLTVEIPAGKTVALAVTAERARQESVQLAGLTPQRIEFFVSAKELPAEFRQHLAKLGALRATVAEREQAVNRLTTTKETIESEQQRLRENLQAVGQTSDIGRRYMAKLNEQENRVDTLEKNLTAAQTALDAAQQAVADYVKSIKL